MADNFDTARNRGELGNPAVYAVAVTPHATNALAEVPQALYVGVGGDLTVRMLGGTADIVVKAAANGYHPLRVTHVRATGTTATDILALY
jgi:hypothetical protein